MSIQTPPDDRYSLPGQSSALRRRTPILVLLSANAISMIGNQLTLVAVPWFVLQTTGSATKLGITAFFEALAAVVAAFFGGILVDSLGFKCSSSIADGASGLAIACVPLLYTSLGLAFWQLLTLVFLSTFFNIPGETARLALLPELADLASMRLERASALLQAIERGSRLAGAPLAGLCIALLGSSQVLWLDAVTFLLSAIMVAWAVPFSRLHVSTASEKTGTSLVVLLEGVRAIGRDRLLLAIVLIVMIMNFVDTPFSGVLLPVYVKQTVGNAFALGLLIAGAGAGAVIGAALFAALGHKLPRWRIFLGSLFFLTLRYWLFSILPSFAILLLIQIFAGIASGPLNPIINTIEYERIPTERRGRVLGTIASSVSLAVPPGMLLVGFLMGAIGVQWTLVAAATCYLCILLSVLLLPPFRAMDVPTEEGK